jgi:hypothetical protein
MLYASGDAKVVTLVSQLGMNLCRPSVGNVATGAGHAKEKGIKEENATWRDHCDT